MRAWIASKGVRRTEPEFELRDALREPGCAVCRLASRTAARQLDIISYEAVNDLEVRDRLRAARGFCHRHAWQFLEETRDPLGTALIYRDTINTLTRLLQPGDRLAPLASLLARLRGPRGPRRHSALARRLEPRLGCPICAWEAETEETYLELLGARLHEPELTAALESSAGLCWPHLLRALERVRTQSALRAIVRRRLEPSAPQPHDGEDERSLGLGLAFGLAREHGYLRAERTLLPPELVVDLQRRRLEEVVRPGPAADPDCAACASIRRQPVAHGQPALDRLREPDHADPPDVAALCGRHAWSLFAAKGDALAPILARLTIARDEALRKAIDLASHERPALRGPGEPEARHLGRGVARMLRSTEACPLCVQMEQLDARAVSVLLERHEAGRSGGSIGSLCLPHLSLAADRVVGAATWDTLLARQVAAWRALSADLAEFARKHDYRFRHEPRGPEQVSPWRAVEQIAGPR